MAPFNTHFLVAEKVWPIMPEGPWLDHFGQFCFGCVAPDVDKASDTLTQKDTHFYDKTTDYELMAKARSTAFLSQQDTFLTAPFHHLSAEAQAFVLGYLCHLTVDEVTKHQWRYETWMKFGNIRPTSAFAALDEIAWEKTDDYELIRAVLNDVEAQNVITVIPIHDLEKMLRGVQAFATARQIDGEYIALLKVFGQFSADEEQDKLKLLQQELVIARERVHNFQIEAAVEASIIHTTNRINDLLKGHRPDPAYPALLGTESA